MKTVLLLALCALSCAAQELRVYAIDVEGGKATLYVSPSGESMLVDAGHADALETARIVAAIAEAGLQQIDYLVSTHTTTEITSAVWQRSRRRFPSATSSITARISRR